MVSVSQPTVVSAVANRVQPKMHFAAIFFELIFMIVTQLINGVGIVQKLSRRSGIGFQPVDFCRTGWKSIPRDA